MAEPDYHDELNAIVDSAEAKTAALLLSVLFSEYGMTAASKFSPVKAISALKSVKNKKLTSSLDIAITPAVIAAIDLLRENKHIGSVFNMAKKAVAHAISKADEYYDDRNFQAYSDRERSARMAARWLIRDAVFSGQTEAANSLGFTKKKWVTRQDNRVRHSHNYLDGQVVAIDGKFTTNGGVRIAYPGDAQAPLSEIINCRCSLEFL